MKISKTKKISLQQFLPLSEAEIWCLLHPAEANLGFERVLTMAYNTNNYWVFGLCPSSGIVGTRKHDVSETGSVSVLRCVHICWLSPAELAWSQVIK
jgi:hypothetical protein